MEYTAEDSERHLAQDYETCVLFILQMHAANYVSDVSDLLAFSHLIFDYGKVKDLLVKTREHMR
jgi:hypothetical protein